MRSRLGSAGVRDSSACALFKKKRKEKKEVPRVYIRSDNIYPLLNHHAPFLLCHLNSARVTLLTKISYPNVEISHSFVDTILLLCSIQVIAVDLCTACFPKW